MTCRAILVDPNKNDFVESKVMLITDDTYPICQQRVDKLNLKLKNKKSDKYWLITDINV